MENIKNLVENKDFVEKLMGTETNEEVIAVFAEFGVTVTEAELDEAVELVRKKGAELGEDDLDAVAGGFISATVAGCGVVGWLLLQVGDRTGAWDWWRKKLG